MHPGATGRRAYRHRPVCADSDLGRIVDNRAFEVELLLYDGADRESEEMRVLVCDHLAPCEQLRGGTVKEQLDFQPIARSDAGSFASSPLTIRTVSDELDARSECERVPQRDSQCFWKRPRERVGDLVADAARLRPGDGVEALVQRFRLRGEIEQLGARQGVVTDEVPTASERRSASRRRAKNRGWKLGSTGPLPPIETLGCRTLDREDALDTAAPMLGAPPRPVLRTHPRERDLPQLVASDPSPQDDRL